MFTLAIPQPKVFFFCSLGINFYYHKADLAVTNTHTNRFIVKFRKRVLTTNLIESFYYVSNEDLENKSLNGLILVLLLAFWRKKKARVNSTSMHAQRKRQKYRQITSYNFQLSLQTQNSFREDIKSEIRILRWNLSLLQPLEKMTELKMQWRNCYAPY